MTTFKTSNQTPKQVKTSSTYTYSGITTKTTIESSESFKSEKCQTILSQTSLPPSYQYSSNGFVHTITQSYNQHHHLVIKPDDVWLAIIVQFGRYVDANAEALRHLFVEHEGKKKVVVEGTHFADLALTMGQELKNHVKDPELCDWIIPGFSTTTENDRIVGSVLLMATMKKYFSYGFSLMCGIPEVTLLGTLQDWENLHVRVGRLATFGPVCEKWGNMLMKITNQFVESKKGNVDLDFWGKVCHYSGGGSGPTYLSGWITAFCVFDNSGNCAIKMNEKRGLIDYEYPRIDTDDIPNGYLSVDVEVNDNGNKFNSVMFAGHTGYDIVLDGYGVAPQLSWHIATTTKTSSNANDN
jgi:hypothetical protein